MQKIALFLFLFICKMGFSQKPIGKFIEDSLTIGKPIQYSLSFKHDANQEILFPDSTFNFDKFLFIKKEAFPTKTTNNISIDSSIYTFISFEIDSFQKLALPVFLFYELDSLKLLAEPDTIIIKEQIKTNELAQAEIKSKLEFIEFKDDIQFFKVGLYILLFVILSLIIYYYFNQNISKFIYKLKVQWRHNKFIRNQKSYERATLTSEKINEALVEWKNYMEIIEDKPFSSFTSSEIFEYYKDERLFEALKDLDTAIYGKFVPSSTPFALIVLRNIATNQFNKLKKIINE